MQLLREECKVRGLKEYRGRGKDVILQVLVKNTICMAGTKDYKELQKIWKVFKEDKSNQ